MREQATRFGHRDHLVGLVGRAVRTASTGILIANTGMVHRVGPSRLHVELARSLNAAGYPTLRFDLSTLGDSDASGQRLSRSEQNLADMAAAMDLLTDVAGCTRFVLFGLCSGATVAHEAAVQLAPRVAGAVFIDGYTYRTPGFMLRYYLPRLLSARRIMQRMQRGHARREIAFAFDVPPRTRVRRQYRQMLAQGMQLCFIFSGGIGYYFNHPRQFRESFGRDVAGHPGVTLHYLPHTDHTYSLSGDREQLIGSIKTWLHGSVPTERSEDEKT